jgi:hypothetical protein
MNSIQRLFRLPLFEDVNRLALFRCKQVHDSYKRNIEWLSSGQTGWWSIADKQDFGGVVILLDAMDKARVEVWAGRSFGDDSGRREINEENRWKLRVEGPFQFMGSIKANEIQLFLSKQPGNGVTYIDRNVAAPLVPPLVEPARGFNPEFAGDRAPVRPGSYTPNSTHGKAITAFHAWLLTNGYRDLDNISGWWDMHGIASDGEPHLFELKTDSGTTSVHTAIGQLLMYELETDPCRKIMVLPNSPNCLNIWQQRLAALRIGLITFVETTHGFRFIEN